jgi:hypothetical protein
MVSAIGKAYRARSMKDHRQGQHEEHWGRRLGSLCYALRYYCWFDPLDRDWVDDVEMCSVGSKKGRGFADLLKREEKERNCERWRSEWKMVVLSCRIGPSYYCTESLE